MKVAVLVKEVPDLEALVKVVDGGAALEIEKRRMLNFFDEIAVEAALGLKESAGAPRPTWSPPEPARAWRRCGAAWPWASSRPSWSTIRRSTGADPLTVARALTAVLRP